MFNLVGKADLRISSSVRRRVLSAGDSTTIFVAVTNDGPVSASLISWQCRLPSNVTAQPVSGNLTVSGTVVNGSIATLTAGASQVMAFRILIQADGIYRLATEVMQVTNADPDSQPGTGTADGQDDATQVDIRVGNGMTLFASPNPNQVPLPACTKQPACLQCLIWLI